MENHNLVKIEEKKITLKYETETLIFETQKNPIYCVGTEFINFKGERFFFTKRKS